MKASKRCRTEAVSLYEHQQRALIEVTRALGWEPTRMSTGETVSLIVDVVLGRPEFFLAEMARMRRYQEQEGCTVLDQIRLRLLVPPVPASSD